MRLPRRDIIATGLVAVAGILCLLWAIGRTAPAMTSVRVTGTAILALGFAASATAVVPGFDGLLHGNKVYLTLASAIGLGAFAGGVVMLITGSSTALAVVVVTMGVLWLAATVRHAVLARAATPTADTPYPTGRPAARAG